MVFPFLYHFLCYGLPHSKQLYLLFIYFSFSKYKYAMLTACCIGNHCTYASNWSWKNNHYEYCNKIILIYVILQLTALQNIIHTMNEFPETKWVLKSTSILYRCTCLSFFSNTAVIISCLKFDDNHEIKLFILQVLQIYASLKNYVFT